MFEWSYDGVNGSIPRNAGPECGNFLSLQYRIIETIGVSFFIIYLIVKGYKTIKIPKNIKYVNQDRTGKKFLLCIMSLFLGMEIGFKFNSRTVVYLLNPCHVTTAIQLYILIAKPSTTVTALFRIQLNLMNGPVLAYLFPETESRRIFADKSMYYLQHGLMVIIPYYLLRIGGVYSIEPLSDLSWSMLSYGLNLGYHFWILQPISLPIQVNLNHVLCPAILDPFEGQWYRLFAVVHQGLLCPILYKLFCIVADFLLTKFPLTKVKSSINDTIDYDFPVSSGITGPKDDSVNGAVHVD